ncbi:VPLPA-CTERM sorting domain-containing protein [Primorskyibacter sp. S187A]|uniref:VPLPA-CTERM sorting domain-containing protein n=1 Tax=Primorskyibacter sp. S187A TaxID=3415130 RepID=UPI003C7AAD45
MKLYSVGLAVAMIGLAGMAQAATTTFTAEDVLPTGLGTLQTERSNWQTAVGSPVSSEGFEGLQGAVGNTLTFADFTLTHSGGGLTLFGSNSLTRTEGVQGLGFSGNGSVTFTFASTINAFGIDWSSFDQTSTVVDYSDDGGNSLSDLFVPVTNAGAGFFGIIDTGGFSSVTFNVSQTEILEFDNIAWGTVAPVPLPAGLPLLLAGLGGLAMLRRRT